YTRRSRAAGESSAPRARGAAGSRRAGGSGSGRRRAWSAARRTARSPSRRGSRGSRSEGAPPRGRRPSSWRSPWSGGRTTAARGRSSGTRATRSPPRRRARRSGAGGAGSARASEQPRTVLLDNLAVELDPRAGHPQVLDDVPVDAGRGGPADVRHTVAQRKVHRSVDLLVEERVAHVPGDARVAADAELAEAPRAGVGVEHLDEVRLGRLPGRVHHCPAL